MFCANCGKKMDDRDLFCSECGTPAAFTAKPQPTPPVPESPAAEPAQPFAETPVESFAEEPLWSAPVESAQPPLETPVWTRATDLDESPDVNPVQASVEPPVWSPVKDPVQPPVEPPVWPPVKDPGQSPVNKPGKPKKSKKKNPLRIILPIVAGVAVLAVLAVVLLGLIGGPSAKVGVAFANTAKEYAKVSEKLGMPKAEKSTEIEPFTEIVELELKDFPEMPELEGFGARVEMGMDLEGRELGFAVTPIYASLDIVDAQILLQDDELYASVPQLTNGRAYMVNTETIGQTLVDLGANSEAIDLSVNVFDLIEIIQEYTQLNEKTQKKITEAVADLAKEIEIEKDGNDTLEINDHDQKCVMYDVVIPEEALVDYLEVIVDVYNDVDAVQMITDVMEEIGFPDYVIEEATMGMDQVDMAYAMESVYMAIEELGDIELQVGIHKGLVAYVGWDVSIEDTNMELSLQLGGGKEYVDDLRLEMEVEGNGKIVITSSGDHACSDGTFTDETTFALITDYEEITATSEMSYEPKAKSDNFQWTLKAMDDEFSVSGQVSFDEDRTLLDLDDVSYWYYGEKLIGMRMYVELGKYEPVDLDTDDAVEILALSEDELYEELAIIEESAMAWAEDLMASNPELISLLESFMYY